MASAWPAPARLCRWGRSHRILHDWIWTFHDCHLGRSLDVHTSIRATLGNTPCFWTRKESSGWQHSEQRRGHAHDHRWFIGWMDGRIYSKRPTALDRPFFLFFPSATSLLLLAYVFFFPLLTSKIPYLLLCLIYHTHVCTYIHCR